MATAHATMGAYTAAFATAAATESVVFVGSAYEFDASVSFSSAVRDIVWRFGGTAGAEYRCRRLIDERAFR
jgi:hypothetical protein